MVISRTLEQWLKHYDGNQARQVRGNVPPHNQYVTTDLALKYQ